MSNIWKKLSLLLLVTFLLIGFTAPSQIVQANNSIKVTVNGNPLYFDDAGPIIENGRVLVPMRGIFEALGAQVDWFDETRTIKATLDRTEIILVIDRWLAQVDGKDVLLDVQAKIKQNRAYIPLRFIGESLGAEVNWHSDTQLVEIIHHSELATPTLEMVWSLGAPAEMYDWIQGVTKSGDTFYALDGIKVKSYKNGKENLILHMQDLAPLLKPYGLDDPSTIHSFRLSDMQVKDGRLYISGLMFVNKENEIYNYYNQDILLLGFSYNVIFYIEDGKPTILYVERAKVHEKPDNFTWYETKSGQPENFHQWGDFYLFDYSRYLLKLRFTFAEDGSIIVPRELGQRHYEDQGNGRQSVSHEYQSIIRITPDGQVEELFSWGSALGSIRPYSYIYATDRHVLPLYEDHQLTLYSGNQYIMNVDLENEERTFIELPSGLYHHEDYTYAMERPLYYQKQLYFLNDYGIFTLKDNKPQMLIWSEDIDFSGIDHTVYIVDFDYDGKYFYITDFTSRSIYRLKAN